MVLENKYLLLYTHLSLQTRKDYLNKNIPYPGQPLSTRNKLVTLWVNYHQQQGKSTRTQKRVPYALNHFVLRDEFPACFFQSVRFSNGCGQVLTRRRPDRPVCNLDEHPIDKRKTGRKQDIKIFPIQKSTCCEHVYLDYSLEKFKKYVAGTVCNSYILVYTFLFLILVILKF